MILKYGESAIRNRGRLGFLEDDQTPGIVAEDELDFVLVRI